jgi:phosphotransferase system  glucose/maltose/N-acetylglucosamine-specific IIC component
MHTLEIGIFDAVKSFLELPFGIGGLIVGGLQQVIVVSGVHHVFNALEIELLATTGRDAFNAIITGAIVAQGGAALAVALKTKDPKKRSLYISSTIPAFLGITEPAIFGINLRFVKPFVYFLLRNEVVGLFVQFFAWNIAPTVIERHFVRHPGSPRHECGEKHEKHNYGNFFLHVDGDFCCFLQISSIYPLVNMS